MGDQRPDLVAIGKKIMPKGLTYPQLFCFRDNRGCGMQALAAMPGYSAKPLI